MYSTSEMLASIFWWSVESWAVVDVSRSSLETAVSSEDAVCCWCWERLVVSVLNLAFTCCVREDWVVLS